VDSGLDGRRLESLIELHNAAGQSRLNVRTISQFHAIWAQTERMAVIETRETLQWPLDNFTAPAPSIQYSAGTWEL